jgi:hypothetical protein
MELGNETDGARNRIVWVRASIALSLVELGIG